MFNKHIYTHNIVFEWNHFKFKYFHYSSKNQFIASTKVTLNALLHPTATPSTFFLTSFSHIFFSFGSTANYCMRCFWQAQQIWLLIGTGSCWSSKWEMLSTFLTGRQIFRWFESDNWQVDLPPAEADPFFCHTSELVRGTYGADTVCLVKVNWVL